MKEGEAEGAGNSAQGGVSGSGGSCSGKFQGDGEAENGSPAPRPEGEFGHEGPQERGPVAGGLALSPFPVGKASLSHPRLPGRQTSLPRSWLRNNGARSETGG